MSFTIITGAAMNIILRCAFGLELDAYSNKNNPVAEKINKASDELLASFAMKSPVEVFFFQLFFVYFPGIMNLIPMWPQAYDDLWKISDGIMKVNMTTCLQDRYLHSITNISAKRKLWGEPERLPLTSP